MVVSPEASSDEEIVELEQLVGHEVETEIKEVSEDTTCGIGCVRGSWLQRFANMSSFIIVFGLLGSLNSAWGTYFNGCITTMEKRFKIPSKLMGFLAASSDIIQGTVPPFVTYYTDKLHRPRWIAYGSYCVVASCFIMAFPHFIHGPGEAQQLTLEYWNQSSISRLNHSKIESGLDDRDLCDEHRSHVCNIEEPEGWLSPVIILSAQWINGVGQGLCGNLGTAYVDDNADKSNIPKLLSFSYFVRAIGPGIGYGIASLSLKLFVAPQLTPIIDESDARWVGAWWFGWIVLGILFFLNTYIIGLFPKKLPNYSQLKVKQQVILEKPTINGMLQTFKRLITNPIIACNNLSAIFYVFGSMAYWMFLPKYLELQYGQSASTSNLITGFVNFIFYSAGILASGMAISKYKFGARTLAGWNALVGLLSAFGMFFYVLLGCEISEASDVASITTNLTCYSDCNCDFIQYNPVCGGDGVNYISPCHAGCTSYNGTMYVDCSCIDHGGLATSGRCPIDCYFKFLLFVAIVCLVNFLGSSGLASNLLVELRAVEERDKATSLAYSGALICLLAVLPAPILFGYVLDAACLVWGKTCESTGNCWVYDVTLIRYLINYTAGVFLFLGALFDLGVWYLAKDLKIFDDEEEEEDAKRDKI